MIQYLEKLILDNWDKWVGENKPAKLDFLKTHAGNATRNKKVGFFVFNDKIPVIFAKTVREEGYNKIIEDGFKKLIDATSRLNDKSAPRPLYLGEYNGIKFSLEEAVVGKQYHSFKKNNDLKEFLGWFSRFQNTMAKDKQMVDLGEYINRLTEKFIKKFEVRGLEKMDVKNISIPLISQHGDLTPDNVLKSNGEIRVIDWDSFGDITLPMFDLLGFLQRWSRTRDISFVDVFSEIINQYLKEFGIDKRALKPIVFTYYLLDFLRKKDKLEIYDKEYLILRFKELQEKEFKL